MELNAQKHKEFLEKFEEETERRMESTMRVSANKERNVEQRTKVEFAN